jgi:hypothetical protein
MRSTLGSHPQQELSYRTGLLKGEMLAFLTVDDLNLKHELRPGPSLKVPA